MKNDIILQTYLFDKVIYRMMTFKNSNLMAKAFVSNSKLGISHYCTIRIDWKFRNYISFCVYLMTYVINIPCKDHKKCLNFVCFTAISNLCLHWQNMECVATYFDVLSHILRWNCYFRLVLDLYFCTSWITRQLHIE